MEMIFCPNCRNLTGYKRALGFGTFFAVFLTAGFWLLALPFYPKRCITCGLRKSDSVPWYRTWRTVAAALMVLAGCALAVLVVAHLRGSTPKVSSIELLGFQPGAKGSGVHASAITFRLGGCEDKGDDFKYCHYVRDKDEKLLLIFWRDELETVEYECGIERYRSLFKDVSARYGAPRQSDDRSDGYWGSYSEGAILSLIERADHSGGTAQLTLHGGELDEHMKTAFPIPPQQKWPEIPQQMLPEVKKAEQRLFGKEAVQVESFTLGLGDGGELHGTWAVMGGCKPHDCGDHNAMWTVDLSTGQAAG